MQYPVSTVLQISVILPLLSALYFELTGLKCVPVPLAVAPPAAFFDTQICPLAADTLSEDLAVRGAEHSCSHVNLQH